MKKLLILGALLVYSVFLVSAAGNPLLPCEVGSDYYQHDEKVVKKVKVVREDYWVDSQWTEWLGYKEWHNGVLFADTYSPNVCH